MPLGDALTVDYQWQLGSTVYGAGSNSTYLELPHVDGLGVPEAKTQDVVWNLKDGSYANPDYLMPRLIVIPAMIRTTTEALAMTALKALTLDWVPQIADIDLAFKLPGWNVFYVMGRPRGVKADLTLARNKGVVRLLLRFDCPDPTITYI